MRRCFSKNFILPLLTFTGTPCLYVDRKSFQLSLVYIAVNIPSLKILSPVSIYFINF